MSNIMSPALKLAIKAAKAGGDFVLKNFGKQHKVTFKNNVSPVTQVDLDAEKIIRKIISAENPDANFVGEELGGDIRSGTFWTIDSLDGTRDFVKGSPIWGT